MGLDCEVLRMRCKKHPRYQMKRRPTAPCIGCWWVYTHSTDAHYNEMMRSLEYED